MDVHLQTDSTKLEQLSKVKKWLLSNHVMKKMLIQTITLIRAVHIGKKINGAINAVTLLPTKTTVHERLIKQPIVLISGL